MDGAGLSGFVRLLRNVRSVAAVVLLLLYLLVFGPLAMYLWLLPASWLRPAHRAFRWLMPLTLNRPQACVSSVIQLPSDCAQQT